MKMNKTVFWPGIVPYTDSLISSDLWFTRLSWLDITIWLATLLEILLACRFYLIKRHDNNIVGYSLCCFSLRLGHLCTFFSLFFRVSWQGSSHYHHVSSAAILGLCRFPEHCLMVHPILHLTLPSAILRAKILGTDFKTLLLQSVRISDIRDFRPQRLEISKLLHVITLSFNLAKGSSH